MKKQFLSATAVLLLVSAVAGLQDTNTVAALTIDQQIEAVQRQIDRYQQESEKLKNQAASIEKELAGLVAKKQSIEEQIKLTQLKHDKLQHEIEATQQRLNSQRKTLGTLIADMYIDNDISPLEMLASSTSISEYVDRSAYKSIAASKLADAAKEINELKQTLSLKQQETKRLLGEQRLAKQALTESENKKQDLLAHTKGDEARYKAMVSERERHKGELHRQQQAAIEAAMRRGGAGSGPLLIGDASKGGYPWEAGCWINENAWSYGGANGNGEDPLGYGCRQCVSYTAFKVGQRTGNYPRYWGNANMWPSSARAAGYATGSTPRANAVGVIMSGQYGHTAWIESVNGDGTLTISQYNYYNAGGPGWGHYSKMRVSAATYDTYIYF